MRGPPGPSDRAAAARVAAAAGQGSGVAGPEAPATEGGPAGAVAAGWVVRRPLRERPGVRQPGEREDARPIGDRTGVDSYGEEGLFPELRPDGAGPAGGEAGPEVESLFQDVIALRRRDPGRPGLRPAGPRRDGRAVQPPGGALRARERDAVEQPGVFRMGGDLQGRDDDGGGDRPPGPPLRDPGVERAELPRGAGQEGPSDARRGSITTG